MLSGYTNNDSGGESNLSSGFGNQFTNSTNSLMSGRLNISNTDVQNVIFGNLIIQQMRLIQW